MLLKLILFVLLIYWGNKLFKSLLNSTPHNNGVKGKPRRNEPLDLSKYDVEDAEYEELDE